MAQVATLAWDLVEKHRCQLTTTELDFAFVHLGADEYVEAIRCVVKAVVRERADLGYDLATRLGAWVRSNTVDDELSRLLSQAIRGRPQRGVEAPQRRADTG